MVQSISSLKWQSLSATGLSQFVAVQQCDAAIDTVWKIYLAGTEFDLPKNVKANFIAVDNLSNNGIAQIVYGPFSYGVPQFSRKLFKLPPLTASVQLTVTVGIVTLYVAETPDYLSEELDYLSSLVAAGTNVAYPWITYTAAIVNQSLSADANHNIIFSRAGGLTYNLLPANTVPNGFLNPDIVVLGTGNLTIVPAGADSIIGMGGVTYTNAAPLVLQPGERIIFAGDGVSWYAFDHAGIVTNHIWGTNGINCDPPTGSARIMLRTQARGFNDVGLELDRQDANTAILHAFNRNAGTWKTLIFDGSGFQWTVNGSQALAQLVATGSLANLFLAGLTLSAFVGSNGGDLANGAALDLVTNQGGGGWSGILIAVNTDPANAGFRTMQIYGVTGRGAAAPSTLLVTNTGPGACPFALSVPANGTIRLTNNYGAASHADMAFFGLTHL